MFRTGKSSLTFAESVSDLDSEGSRSGYTLPAFLSLTGSVANGDAGLESDLALSRVLPVLTVVCGQAPRASLSPSLVCKVERDPVPPSHPGKAHCMAHPYCHLSLLMSWSLLLSYRGLSGCISLLLGGFIAVLCQTCVFTPCVILYS